MGEAGGIETVFGLLGSSEAKFGTVMESKLSQCQKNELALTSVSVASEKQFV